MVEAMMKIQKFDLLLCVVWCDFGLEREFTIHLS